MYDIDRIISRTFAYAIVTGVLVGLYAALVLLATRLLSFQTPVAVAAFTLVAAALFNPLRHRVQLRGGSALQPDQIRRRPDGCRVGGPAEGHRGCGIGLR